MKWWIDHIDHSFNLIRQPAVDITMYSDASLHGWTGALDTVSTGGQWSAAEVIQNINYLELRAAFLVMTRFVNKISNKHVKPMIDNTAAVSIM